MAAKDEKSSSCNLEAIVSIDNRGQIVLPKELRNRAGIMDGDKLMVISCTEDDKLCCITLMKADKSNPMVKQMLGPVLKGILKE